MTLHERVAERLDEIERVVDGRGGLTLRVGHRDVWIHPIDKAWTGDHWLPSLRRRAERHQPQSCWPTGCCQPCKSCVGDDELALPYPCPDFRDLCGEIGVDIEPYEGAPRG